MKSKIPQEIDKLMWSVAEEGSPNALTEFEQRYPEHKFELARRLTMVRELRGAKKGKSEVAVRAPRFQPRATAQPAVPSWLRAGLIATGVVSLGAFAFVITSMSATVNPPAPAPVIQTGEPKGPEVVYMPPKQVPAKPVDQPPPVQPKTEPVEAKDALLLPTDIAVEIAPLQTVLRMVAAAGARRITILEGLGNPDIRVDFRKKAPVEILQELGKEYAFTPYDQGDGSIVIVPARDEKEPKPETGAGTKPSTKIQ